MERLSKTDFLLFLDAPLHLWAAKHGRLEVTAPDAFAQHLMEQGKDVERLAQAYVDQALRPTYPQAEFYPQRAFEDGAFYARADFVIYDEQAQVNDLYEVKSATSIKPEYEYDITFQALVCAATIPLRHHYILHLNKDYIRQGDVDIPSLFTVTDMDEVVQKRLLEVSAQRELALQAASQPDPDGLLNCLKPEKCPCPVICHPDLPEFSIYEIPNLYANKARQLQQQGIYNQKDIPQDFKLSNRQQLFVQVTKRRQPLIDLAAIREELASLEYPLYFIDYEAYNPAVPLYDGYHPYQQMVFQYSLHVVDSPGGEITHHEYLSLENADPVPQLVEHMAQNIGSSGSVLVWNRAFEATRNKEMAGLAPQYADFLLDLNQRMYDLRDIFSKGYYVHPDFHGSTSIKYVLPVLAPDLSYDTMTIGDGTQASMAWKRAALGSAPVEERDQIRADLLSYCELDTLAMVRIWQVLQKLVG